MAVDTPGHASGHLSIIVFTENIIYLLTGDATYDQSLLDDEQPDGMTADSYTAVESLRNHKRRRHRRCHRSSHIIIASVLSIGIIIIGLISYMARIFHQIA